jgi:hypothetical protein
MVSEKIPITQGSWKYADVSGWWDLIFADFAFGFELFV